jgi:integrase
MVKRRRRREGWPRVYRRDNGYWYAEWERGKPWALKTRDRETAYRRVEVQLELKKRDKLVRLDRANRIRLSEFKKVYEAERERQLALGEIAESTLRADKLALARLMETAGDIPLRQVNARVRDEFKAKLLAGAKDVTKRMHGVNVYIRHLRAAFNWAMVDDPDMGKPAYIDKNPFAKERGQKPVEFNTGRQLPRFLEVHEIKAVREVLEKRRVAIELRLPDAPDGERRHLEESHARAKDLRNLFEFYLHTGLRRNELVRLEWPDVKLDINVIHVRKTKRKYERYVPIPPRLREVIEEDMGVKDLGPIFPRWRSADHVSRMFTALAREAGVNKTLHSTRHSYGAHAVMSGIDLRTVQEYMGHESISTTQIYAKVSEEHKQRQIRKLRFGMGDE